MNYQTLYLSMLLKYSVWLLGGIMKFIYKFPVVKGTQSEKEYYIAMVPLGMLGKLFPGETEYVLPEYRAQRKLNETRIPEIKRYILENRDTYVFSALAASIDGDFKFVQSEIEDLGVLEVDMGAKFLINDGQHRKAAILAALEEDPSLEDETISVVFYEDKGLSNSQQMFTDLNKHAVKTSNSISELYDSRDPLAVITRNVVSKVPFLYEYVDKEKDILGKFSSSLFTLNVFYTANKRILGRNNCGEDAEKFLIEYWTKVSLHMLPWVEMDGKSLSKIELREQYIASQAVVIQAFGKLGAFFFENKNYDMNTYLKKIETINWKRSNPVWKLRVIRSNGRMINNENAIFLAMIAIKNALGIPLSDDEIFEEDRYQKSIKK